MSKLKWFLLVVVVYVILAVLWEDYRVQQNKEKAIEERCDENWDNPVYKSPLGYEESKEELHRRCVIKSKEGWD